MNKSNLKSYAPQARKDFIAAITARAALLGITADRVVPATVSGGVAIIDGVEWPAKVATQRDALLARMARHGADGFAQTMEEVAYTWFNRFAALRYMELHELLDHGHRVLSSRDGGLPELLRHAADVNLPGLQAARVQDLQLAGNKDNQLYKLLLVTQCNELSRTMPFLFERIDDDTELLLPDNLLRTDSIIAKLVAGVPEADWQEIEVIGWLYQFYISEKKADVIGKVVKSEDIPAATQLFTPNWIVQYLVQNSVGRLWLMANPSSTLGQQWPYFIQPAEQTPEVQAQLDALIQTRIAEDGDTLNPETIRVLDPACGSGHILVVAYDVLKAIYLERGYRLRDIPRLILEKNLYGLDIDDRAAQLAGFALLMKARADDRRLLADPDNPPQLNILSLQESTGLDAQALHAALTAGHSPQASPRAPDAGFADTDLFPATRPQMTLGEAAVLPAPGASTGLTQQAIAELITAFEHAKTVGSLIQIGPQRLPSLCKQLSFLKNAEASGDLYAQAAAKDLLPLVRQALVLGMQFDAVVANPPYMGSKGMNPALKDYARATFPDGKADLFAMFMERGFGWCKPSGLNSMVTMQSWMFLSSYEAMREKLLQERTLSCMVHMGNGVMGIAFGTAATVMLCGHVSDYAGSFSYCENEDIGENEKPKAFPVQNERLKTAKPDDFKNIPGSPVAYWLEKELVGVFSTGQALLEVAEPTVGLQTSNNAKFLRYWHEVGFDNIYLSAKNSEEALASGCKWFPYNKGGDYARWYGNHEYVVNWKNNGEEIKNYVTEKYPYLNGNIDYVVKDRGAYFKESLSYSKITSGRFCVRYYPEGFIFDVAGASIILLDSRMIYKLAGVINSPVIDPLLKAIAPTVNLESGQVAVLPISGLHSIDEKLVKDLIACAKNDWDSRERSWGFQSLPIVREAKANSNICESFAKICEQVNDSIENSLGKERILGESVVSEYGLSDVLKGSINLDDLTLEKADREKDCQRLISYAIGCMMGRYSLDAPGLIYAHSGNVGFDASRYPSFPADADGILPVTDQPWFADDAPTRIREFLHAVWGPDTLEENLAWLAESLGPKGSETPEETIRRYIAGQFFKDHLQTYKKRPIYWLFSSGKQGAFQALVYLHRYHEGTLARMRSEYVIPLTAKYTARLDLLAQDAAAATSAAARTKINKQIETLGKQQAELLGFDEKLRHYADMRITLDLDDGVKVNYGKFGDLLAGVKVVTGGSGDE